jgi:hypothetical protein
MFQTARSGSVDWPTRFTSSRSMISPLPVWGPNGHLRPVQAVPQSAETVRQGQWLELYVWELHLLCREILLHADDSDDTLFSVDGLLELVNHVRRIDQGISERSVTSGESAMSALHPLIH